MERTCNGFLGGGEESGDSWFSHSTYPSPEKKRSRTRKSFRKLEIFSILTIRKEGIKKRKNCKQIKDHGEEENK